MRRENLGKYTLSRRWSRIRGRSFFKHRRISRSSNERFRDNVGRRSQGLIHMPLSDARYRVFPSFIFIAFPSRALFATITPRYFFHLGVNAVSIFARWRSTCLEMHARTHFNFSANFISLTALPGTRLSREKKFYLRALPHFTRHKNARGKYAGAVSRALRLFRRDA